MSAVVRLTVMGIANAHVPCIDCGWPTTTSWFEADWPGHNYATLYECKCGAVVMLADLYEGGVDDLRKLEARS
jgi:hypothetical protein